MRLLSTSNTKTSKGEKAGYLTAILHLAPASLSGRNVCPFASAGCKAACLNTAGMGIFDSVQSARVARTNLLFKDRKAFVAQLHAEIESLERTAKRKRLKLAVRLNGTSDLAWESLAPCLFDRFSHVPFYDYTKVYSRATRALPINYSLTFSRSEKNEAQAIEVLRNGGNVAVVFAGELPAKWNGFKVVSGDDNDLRFRDPRNVVIGLTAKGKAKKDSSGFVVTV